ncbi:MAG: YggS family pyridoxal phosphate-dependent enzyme [Bacteroidales bacterium]
MTPVQQNLTEIRKTIPEHVTLVAVSKFQPIEAVRSAYEIGQRVFGESKVQELTAKQEALPADIQWHFIGHLQTNKVKFITPFVAMIHSVDSLRLLLEINKNAMRDGRTIDILLQIHIAREQTKFGFSPDEAIALLTEHPHTEWSNVRIRGVMGMATFTKDEQQIRTEFQILHDLFDFLKGNFFSKDEYFNELSFGMSDDYPIAIEEGSTMVRIGSSIFGERNY